MIEAYIKETESCITSLETKSRVYSGSNKGSFKDLKFQESILEQAPLIGSMITQSPIATRSSINDEQVSFEDKL